jgi:hypothetical protein
MQMADVGVQYKVTAFKITQGLHASEWGFIDKRGCLANA